MSGQFTIAAGMSTSTDSLVDGFRGLFAGLGYRAIFVGCEVLALMADDSGVMDLPVIVTGGGGRRGTRSGAPDGAPKAAKGAAGEGATGVSITRHVSIWPGSNHMLRRIHESLDLVVHVEPPIAPRELHEEFVKTWPEVDRQFIRAIKLRQKASAPPGILPPACGRGVHGRDAPDEAKISGFPSRPSGFGYQGKTCF